jgi:hypothetical protein
MIVGAWPVEPLATCTCTCGSVYGAARAPTLGIIPNISALRGSSRPLSRSTLAHALTAAALVLRAGTGTHRLVRVPSMYIATASFGELNRRLDVAVSRRRDT